MKKNESLEEKIIDWIEDSTIKMDNGTRALPVNFVDGIVKILNQEVKVALEELTNHVVLHGSGGGSWRRILIIKSEQMINKESQ